MVRHIDSSVPLRSQPAVCSRRDFLRLGAAAVAGPVLSVIAADAQERRREMASIGLYLDGGMPQTDFADWKPNGGERIIGKQFTARDANETKSGVIFGPYFPRMAGVADQMAVIRTMIATSLTHTDADANALLTGGSRTTLSKKLGEVQSGGVPYVFGDLPLVDTNQIYRDPHHPNEALEIRWNPRTNRFDGPPAAATPEERERLTSRRALLGKLNGAPLSGPVAEKWDARQELAFDIAQGNMASFELEARELDRYGDNPFGAALLLARNLAASGRVKSITFRTPDWDKHSNTHEFMDLHARQMDRAVAELIGDHRRGLWRGLFWARGEFGRTPQLNGSAGRDHWSTHSAVLAGENIRGGVVIGETGTDGNPVRGTQTFTDANFRDATLEAMGKEPDFADRVPGLVVRRRAA